MLAINKVFARFCSVVLSRAKRSLIAFVVVLLVITPRGAILFCEFYTLRLELKNINAWSWKEAFLLAVSFDNTYIRKLLRCNN